MEMLLNNNISNYVRVKIKIKILTLILNFSVTKAIQKNTHKI